MAAALFAVPLALLAVARAADWYPGNGAAMSQPSASFYLPSPELLAQCGVMKTVKKTAGGDFTSIQGALDSLNTTLSTNTCVVVADSAIYSERVTVQDFFTNGYRLKIIKDPTLQDSPSLNAFGGLAGFLVRSDSVTISGINIAAGGTLSYGIYSSSASLEVSSVTVTGYSFIDTAGIVISSYSSVAYSTITVQEAQGLALTGWLNRVTNVYVANNSAFVDRVALSVNGASSNTLSGSYFFNGSGTGAYFGLGSAYNSLSGSSVTAYGATHRGIQFQDASSNTVTNSYITDPNCVALHFSGGYGNAVEQSTVVSNASSFPALNIASPGSRAEGVYVANPSGIGVIFEYPGHSSLRNSRVEANSSSYYAVRLNDTSTNTITGSYIFNASGDGVRLLTNARFNVIDQSSITGTGAGKYGVYFDGASSNTVMNSYIQGSMAAYSLNSTITMLRGNSFVASASDGIGLSVANTQGLFAATNTFTGGPAGRAIYLGAGNSSKIELASNTVAGGAYGLDMTDQGAANLVISSLTFQALSPGATAIFIQGGADIYTLNKVRFDSPDIAVNINASLMTGGAIYVYSPAGARASQFLANDPNGYVQWPWPGAQSLMEVLGSTVSVGVQPNGALGYLVIASTDSSFNTGTISSVTVQQLSELTLTGLSHNSTYYITSGALWDQTTYYNPVIMEPVTKIEDPTSVYIDEVGSNTMVASAYAPGAAFTNMQLGWSGVAVSTEPGVYDVWGGTGNYWTTKADMLSVRQDFGVGVIGGKLYAIGGDNSGSLAQNEEYDPATNNWTAKTAMPTARSNFGVGVVGGKVYAVGGINSVPMAQNEEYDPVLNAWSARQPLSTARSGVASGVIGGKLFVVGGYDGANPLAVNEEYDPALNVWNTRAPLPAARTGAEAGTVGGKLYVLGGFNSGYQDKNEEYDPTLNSWTTKMPMPAARFQFAVGAVGGKLYALGGYDGANPINNNEVYDPASNTWASRPPLPDVRYGAGVGAVGGKLYALGGFNTVRLRKNEEYTPGVSRVFTGLKPNTQYTFHAKARDQTGLVGGESLPDISTYTLAAVALMPDGNTFEDVYTSSVIVRWSSGTDAGGYNGEGAFYVLQGSTAPDFTGTLTINQGGNPVHMESLLSNTTYHFRIKAYNVGGYTDDRWLSLGSTVTHIETPTSVYIDDVTTTSIVASAYAPSPAFTGLERGLSAVSVARNEVYDAWGSSGNYWAAKAVMPSPRTYLAAASLEGKVYAVGGYFGGNSSANEAYDPVLNSWLTKADMPTAREYLALAAAGGKLYAVGGVGGPGVNESYDPVANAWATKAALPTPRTNLSAVGMGGKIYAVGGGSGPYFDVCEEYDPLTDAWTTKASMSAARSDFGAAVIDGKMYTLGGFNGTYLASNEVYDPVADSWNEIAPLPATRAYLAAGAVGGKIYAMGGFNGSYVYTTEEYDPASNVWTTKAQVITARYGLGAAAAGGWLYALGGVGGTSLNEAYTPGVSREFTGLTPNTMYLFKAKARNQNGAETEQSVTISTRTLAAVALPETGLAIAAVYASSAAVRWSPGTAAGGYNGPWASYLVVASTSPDYLGTNVSSHTYNYTVNSATLPLSANTSYYFRVQAYNAGGMTDYSWLALGSTVTLVNPPLYMPAVNFSSYSLTVAWGDNGNGPDTWYTAQAATDPGFNTVASSSVTLNATAVISGLQPNTLYYTRVRAVNQTGSPTDWVNLDSLDTDIEPVQSVYFDEIGTNTITASAYASSQAFTSLNLGSSGINVTTGTLYGSWNAVADSWDSKALINTGRYMLAGASLNGKVYSFGGYNGTSHYSLAQEYDPLTNTIRFMTNMPTSRYLLAAAAAAGRVYVLGGSIGAGAKTVNEELDPVSNAWKTRAPMPQARSDFAAAAANGKVYAMGSGTMDEYDPALDSWSSRAPMLTSRTGLAAGVVGGKIYAVGGSGDSAVNEEYDPVLNAWTSKAPMSMGRVGAGAEGAGGKLYVYGGMSGGTQRSINEMYDPVSNSWTTRGSGPTWYYMGTGAAYGKVYGMGGFNGSYLTLNYEYTPGVAKTFAGLQPNTLYNFKARSRNQGGDMTSESPTISTYTLAAVALPVSGEPFAAVYTSSAAVAWSSGTGTAFNGEGASYLVEASTSADYLGSNISSYTYNVDGAALPLAVNTTYYFRVQAYNAGGYTDYSWLMLGSTVTRIETPTSVYIDEVTSATIVASAYAPSPAFTGLEGLGSGVSIARGGVYDLWGSTGNYWTARAGMLSPRSSMATAVLAGRLYAIGGTNASLVIVGLNEAYDPVSDSWATRAAMPTAREYPVAGVVGGRIYAIGGSDGSPVNVNEEYDPVSNSWATRPPMPTARSSMGAAVADGKIYVLAGHNGASLDVNESYDPAAGTWATMTPVPTARHNIAVAAVKDKIYAIGGWTGSVFDSNEEYDPRLNTWSTKAAMPTPRGAFSAGVVGGKIYLVGGTTGYMPGLAANEAYDPETNQWITMAAMSVSRHSPAVGVIGGRLFVAGGYENDIVGVNEEYVPGVARVFGGLQPNTQYAFKARARNISGTVTGESAEVSTYTLAAVGLPAGGNAFGAVYASSAAVNWSSGTGTAFNGPGASYLVVASTSADYLGTNVSSYTYNVAGATLALSANTTYYFRVQAYNAGGMTDYSWLVLGSTSTRIETPTSVYIDEVTTTAVVASAYAPGPAFTGMERGLSAVNITNTGTFGVWGSSGNYWTAKAAMPSARYHAAAAAIGGKFYAVGGYDSTYVAFNEEYDPAANSWAIKTPMPTERYDLAAVATGGKLYAIGGYDSGGNLAVNEEYDPVLNAWTTKKPMPTPRSLAAAGAIAGKIYVAGGGSATNEEYDPVTDSWAAKADMPAARTFLAGAVVDGKLYAVGGSGPSDKNEAYDPVSNTWAAKASMPTARYGLAVGALGGKIYAINGYDSGSLNKNEEYDPASNTWTTRAPMLNAAMYFPAVTVGGKMYIVGGSGTPEQNVQYDPGSSRKFSGLQPNTLYTFKAKARNQAGAETGESAEVSTYTLAAVTLPVSGEPLLAVYTSSTVVVWSSGTTGAFNGEGASFLVQASTSPDYLGANISSYTYNVNGATLPLASNTSYYFRVQAYNAGNMTDYSWLALGSTVTLAATPTALPAAAVSTWTITAAWGANGNGEGTWYTAQASTDAAFNPVLVSSLTLGASAELGPLPVANTYYYLRVNAINRAGSPTPWSALGSTATAVETPTSVYIDEVGTNTVTASAYAASTAFSGLHLGVSGVNVTTGTLYGNWTVDGDSWTTKTSMPTARYAPAAAAVGGKIYVVGGDGGQAVNEEYDPVSNSWVTRAAMPTARYNLAAAAVGGKLYALGGLSGNTLNKNEEYDPVAGAWATRAAMPTARHKLVAAAVNGKIYAVGGYNAGHKNQNEEYDPATDTWVTRAVLPTARNGMVGGVLYGKLYVAGGNNDSYLTVNEEYDPVGNNWTTRAAMPTSKHGAGGGVLGGKFYTAAGFNGGYVSKNEEYDPLSDTWTARAVPLTARSDMAAAVLGGKLYLLGGSSGGFTNKNEAYAPGTSVGFSGLEPNTLYNFKAKARNALGVETGETVTVSTYTLAAVALPEGGMGFSGGEVFAGVYSSSVAVAWSPGTASGGYNGPGARYLVHASTASNFSGSIVSSITYNEDGAVLPLAANTTYYFRVQAYNAGGMTDYSWLVLGSTVTRIETPASVYIDEVGFTTITASAYAPSPAFTGLDRLGSGVSIAKGGVYDLWGSTGDYWNTKAPMSTTRGYLAAGVIGGKLYAVGGLTGGYLDTNEEYDPAANSWATKAAMPTARAALAAGVIGGKLYAVGGDNGGVLDTNEAYDPAANSWAAKAVMPTARAGLSAGVIGGKLYAVGGDNAGYRNTNEEYDPAADSWAAKAVMPTARAYFAAGVIGGKLYAVGGDNGGYLDANEEYDPAANSWAAKAAMPTARVALSAGVMGGKLYAVGGDNAGVLDTNEEYDPAVNIWGTKAAMPSTRGFLAVGVIGGKLYAVGGDNGSYLNTYEEYNPNVSRSFSGLQPNTQYTFKARARGRDGTVTAESVEVSTYTLAYVGLPQGGQAIASVYESSAAVNWSSGTAAVGYNGPGASFLVVASTSPDYLGTNVSSYTYNVDGATLPLSANTTYYFRVQAYNSGGMTDYSWLVLGSTVTQIEAPTSVYVDEVTTTSIVASAYAPGPAFSYMERLGSGVSIAHDGAYDLWGSSGNYWTTKAPMPTSRYLPSAAVIGGRVYVMGGYNGSELAINEEYDPASSNWATKTPMPTARNGLSIVAFGGKIYAVGGSNGGFVNANEEYDPIANSWNTKTPMPTARAVLSAAILGGKVYAIGGANAGGHLQTNEEYDPTSDSWATKTAMPTGRYQLSIAATGAKIYAVGGYNGEDLSTNEEYNPVSNNWGTMTPMPTARNGLSAVAVGGKISVLGGNNASYLTTNEEYDPATNSWATKAAMPTARDLISAVATGGKIYVLGGRNGSDLNTNEEYAPGVSRSFTDLEPNTLYTFKARARNQNGTVTGESVEVSTYTLAAVALPAGGQPFAGVYQTSATVAWSSGTGTAFNGAGASYLVVASTSPDYLGTNVSSYTYQVSSATLDLNPNTSYYFRIQAYNAGHMTDYSWLTLGSTVTLVNPPLALPVQAITTHSVTAAWDANDNPGDTVYTAQIAQDGSFEPVYASTLTTATSFEFAGLPVANTYYFLRVNAVNRAGSPTVWTALGSTVTAIETADSVVFTYVSSKTLHTEAFTPGGFTWLGEELSAVNQALGGSWQGWETVTTHEYSGLAPNTIYAAKAKARNRLGVETASTVEFTTYTLATVSLPQSGELFPVVHLASATVAWSSGTALTGFNGPGASYLVQASTAADFSGTVVSSATVELSAALELNRNTSYYFRALAYNVDNVTDYNWLVLGSTATEIETPSDITFTAVSDTAIEVLVQGQGGFSNLDSGLSSIAKSLNAVYGPWFNSAADTFSGLTPNTLYNFGAKARNLEGRETTEVLRSTWTLAVAPGPSDPSFTGVYASSFTLAWSPAANPAGTTYYAEISTAADLSAVYASSFTLNSAAVFTDLLANTTYYGRVAALNGAGIYSAFADLGHVVTRMEPPTGVYADEVTTATIVVSAYAPGAAFTGMERGLSAVRIAKDGAYEAWGSSGNYWAARTALPSNTGSPAAAALGGKLYVLGGWAGGAPFDHNREYDPALNTWTERAPMPTARYALGAAAIGGKLYAVGGRSGLTSYAVNEEYDPEADAWITRAPMPTERYGLAAAAIAGKLYAAGGFNSVALSANEEYDPAYDRWTVKTGMPTARNYAAGAAVGGRFYMVGGFESSVIAVNEEYDPVMDVWAVRAAMPNANYMLGAAQAGGKLYAVGGYYGGYLDYNSEYDPSADTWTVRAPLPAGRSALAAAGLGGRVYTAGGSVGSYSSLVAAYEPGVTLAFSGLQPNTQYAFKAKARSQEGVETGESVEVTTYTLAAVGLPESGDPFTQVWASSVTVIYSSGSAEGGYNGPGALYQVEASTAADYTGGIYLGALVNPDDLFREVSELASNTTYHFRIMAYNAGDMTDSSWLPLGTTVTHAITPNAAAQPFDAVNQEGVTIQWGRNGNSEGTAYKLHVSSYSDFSLVYSTIYPLYVSTTAIGGLTPNTTWYARAAAVSYSGVQTDYYVIGSTITLMPAPTEMLFVVVSSKSIVAQAYSSYGFPNVAEGLSGIDQALDGVYAGWSTYDTIMHVGMLPNTSHGFKARARNQTGIETAESPEFSTYTLATVSLPQEGPLFTEVWTASVTVHWSSGTAADGFNGPGAEYKLEVSQDPLFSSALDTASTLALSWASELLWPNTTHYYRARAMNSVDVLNSDWLTLGSTSTLANAVSAAAVFEVWPTTVTVDWAALPLFPSSDTCEGYLVEASTAPDFTGVIKSSVTGDNALGSLVVLNLFAETTYYFRVGSLNHNGVPNFALAGSTWTPTENIPPTINDNELGIDYTWYGALPARTYNIDFHDTGGSALENFQVRATTGPLETGTVNADWTDILAGIDADDFTTNWTLTQDFWNLLADGTNFISVQVFDGSGNKDVALDAFMVFKDSTPPTIEHTYDSQVWRSTHGFIVPMTFHDPHSLVNAADAGVWSGPAQSGSVLVPWSSLFSNAAAADRAENLPIGYEAWDLLVDGTNYFSLRAWDYSVPVNTNTWVDAYLVLKDTTPPAALAGLYAVDITTYSAAVTFGAPFETPSRLAEFTVQYASYSVVSATYAVAGSTHVYVSTIGAAAGEDQFIPVPDLGPNTTYYYRAWSRDLAGNWSGLSPVAAVSTLAEVPPVLGQQHLYYSSGTLSWVPVDSAGYLLEASTAADFSGTLLSSAGADASASGLYAEGLAPNTTYYLRAASLNWSGAANYTGIYEDSTFAVAPGSAAPYAAVSSVSVTVEWLSNNNGPGTIYFIDISSDAFLSFMYTVMERPSGPGPYAHEFAGLQPNTTYWFRAMSAGNRGDFTDWLPLGSTVTTPVQPLLLSYDLYVTSAVVNWDANGNGAGTIYQADLSTAADFTGTLLSSVTASLFTFEMGPVTPNATYYLRLRAVSAATGMASLYRYTDGLSLAAAPDAIGAWTQGPNNIGVYWDAPGNPGVTGYGAFSAGTGLPEAVYGHAGAVAGDLVFVAGGYNGTAYKSEVWSAPLSAEGAIGVWKQTRPLPAARYAHSAAALRGRLYVIGGYDGSAARAEVWSAPISSSGALGDWVAEAPLPQAVYAHAFTVGENTLYVLGGYNGGPVNKVWYTRADPDGSLAAWNPGPDLPAAAYLCAAGMDGASLYVSGGYDSVTAKDEVWRSDVDPDGGLAGWAADTALPSGVYAHALDAQPGMLIISGGNGGTFAGSATLMGALNADGSIAGWSAGAALPAARQSHVMFSRGSRLIVMGGNDGAAPKTDGYYATLAGTEYRLDITGAPFTETPWMAAGWQDAGSLVPNSYYIFRPLARNYAGIEAPGAVTYSTFTYAAQPSSAAITGVFISSAQANWLPADNPAGTRYEAQLSSDAAHTQLAFSSVTANSYAVFTGLDDDYTYHARVRALNDVNVATAWTALGSTTTRADPALDFTSPTVTSNMTGEPAWLNHGATLYDIDLADAGGAWLAALEVGVSTTPADPLPAWSAVLTGMNTENYTSDWALPAGLFDLLEPGTSYISVRAWDGNGNSTTTVDAFYILKDTAAPVITDLQTGEDAWRMDDAGAVYNVDFADDVSGLATFEYSASFNQGTGDAAGLAWRPVVAFSTGLKAFTDSWAVDFAALPNDATSFISVRAADLAGNAVTVTGIDVFKILKYVSGPEVNFTAPDTAFHSALPLIAGTADDSRSHPASAVEVSVLEEATGKYWDGAGFLAGSRKWHVVSGTGAWSYTHGITWLENYAYQVVARSSDVAGNYSLNYATRSFTYDSLAPVIAPLSPADGATVNSAFVISGTAFDAAGYAGMAIKVKDIDSGYWWDFVASTWSVAGSSAAVTAGNSWSYTVPALLAASIADGASYYYTLYAVDNSSPARTTDFQVYGATFAFTDDTAPAAVTGLVASSGSAPGNIQLNWAAPGDDGAAGTILSGQYRIQYSTAADIVFSTADAQVVEDFAAVAAGAARAKELTGLMPGVEYFLRLWTRDDAYNWSALSNAATAQASPFPDRVGGHVMTVSSAGITGVLVEAFDSTGLLQGSAYTLNDGSGIYVITGLAAGSYRVQATWEAEDIISSVGTDGIALGASAVDFTLSITYDLASIGGELAGYRISARGFNTQGIRPRAANVELYQRGRLVATSPIDGNGRFNFGNLLPGKYTLKVPEPAGGSKELSVRVKPGEALMISPLGELLNTGRVYVYPNPARHTATFHIESEQSPLQVRLAIFNIAGKLVGKLAESDFAGCGPNCYEAAWEVPSGVASGVYFYTVHVKNPTSGEHEKVVKKFAIVK